MQDYSITTDEIKLTVEKPDELTMVCKEHIFSIKQIEGKGKLLVYALREGDHYDIQCADWLVDLKSTQI